MVSRKIESVTIFRIVKDVDPNAFITQANVNGVYGQGFDPIKLKADEELSKKLGEEADSASTQEVGSDAALAVNSKNSEAD